MIRGGFALVISLLVFVALAGLGASMLAVGARERTIAARTASAAMAQRRAEDAVRATVARWSTRDFEGMPVPGARQGPGPGAGALVTVRRLDRALFLVRADTRVGGGRGAATGRAAALVRTLDAHSIMDAFPAAVTTTEGATLIDGVIEVAPGCGVEAGVGVAGPLLFRGPAVEVAGEPAHTDRVPQLPVVDPLSPPLLDQLPHFTAGPGTAAPAPSAAADGCIPGPGNWGAISPAHPCYGLLPLVEGWGPLEVWTGEGRGILTVRGDLRLGGAVRFHGLVLVDGALEVAAGAVIRGAVRARTVTLSGGRISFDPCARAEAASAPLLDAAFRLPGRSWVPVF